MGTEIHASFGYWVRRRRKALDLTQEQLAERASCSAALIRKIETDERRPSNEIAELLAKALEIAPADHATFLKVARGERAVARLAQMGEPQISTPSLAALAAPVPPPSAQAPPVQTVQRPWPHLPIPPNALVGRKAELAMLIHLLRDPQCRLLTINGAGGMGKTRLSLELARHNQTDFADGLYFVNLAAVAHKELLAAAVAATIGLNFAGPLQQETQLIAFLQHKEMLLILDNFEHLIEGSALVGELLAAAPHLTLLVTSREPLGLQAEWVFTLDGLATAEPQSTQSSAAVELFVQRASQVQVGFHLTPTNRGAIQQICQSVEGMPLAIELAATWVRTLSCAEIAQQIEQGIDFLVSSGRDLPLRHRSITAVFDHSWQLLSNTEQQTLAQLAVFQGGFTRQAAQMVAGASLFLLSTLVSKSLVRVTNGRYDLHELVRQFAAARFESKELARTTQRRHAEYYLAFLGEREAALQGAEQLQVVDELKREVGNLRRAWEVGGQEQQWSHLFAALRCYWAFFDLQGLAGEGSSTTERIIQLLAAYPDTVEKQRTLGRMLCYCGFFYFRQGDHALAHSYLQRSILLLRSVNDSALLCEPLIFHSVVLFLMGNPSQAHAELEEGLAKAQAAQEDWFVALALLNRGYLFYFMGANHEIYGQMQSALAIWRRLGGLRAIALALSYLSAVAIELGYYGDAQRYLDESLTLSQQLGDHWLTGTSYSHLGMLAHAQGQLAQAEIAYQRAIAIFQTMQLQRDLCIAQVFMGEVQMARGTLIAARQSVLAGLHLAQQIQSTLTVLAALLDLVELMPEEDAVRRLTITYFVLQHPARTQRLIQDGERLRVTLASRLTASQIEEVQQRLSTLTLDAVVAHFYRS